MKKIKNKKGLSEIISYVLLIVIALAMASAVFIFLKGYLPSQNPKETCNEDVSLILQDYTCDKNNNLITLKLKNQGLFNIDGFFIRATNSTNEKEVPIYTLICTTSIQCNIDGRFDFTTTLNPQATQSAVLNYTKLQNITRIQFQSYVKAKNSNDALLCENNIVTLKIEGCD